MEALLVAGPEAVRVEPLASQLGTTKGSFYWHFDRRDDLLEAALERWEQRYTDRFIARTEAAGGAALERLRRLLEAVTVQAPDLVGEARLHAAATDPRVGPTVRRVHARRTAYVADLLRQMEVPDAEVRAELAYATVLGIEQLHASGTAVAQGHHLTEALLATLTGRGD